MKELMLGNKAFARGLYEAGCSFISSYPGTPSTEVTEEAVKYDEIYPEYGFAKNKGYGSSEHIEALKKYGPTPIHRRSFIKNFV